MSFLFFSFSLSFSVLVFFFFFFSLSLSLCVSCKNGGVGLFTCCVLGLSDDFRVKVKIVRVK